jgi:hypothetical protein
MLWKFLGKNGSLTLKPPTIPSLAPSTVIETKEKINEPPAAANKHYILSNQVDNEGKPLPKGVVILRGFLSLEEQNELVQMFQDYRSPPEKDAYIPHFKLRDTFAFGYLYFYSLGHHWDATKGTYSKVRGDVDKSAVPDVPPLLHDLYQRIFAAGSPCDEMFGGARNSKPTSALLNYYPPVWGSLVCSSCTTFLSLDYFLLPSFLPSSLLFLLQWFLLKHHSSITI